MTKFVGMGGALRGAGVVGGAIVSLAALGSGAALAQNCTAAPAAYGSLGAFIPSVAGNIASAVTTANIAFLSQNSAFVGGGAGDPGGRLSGGVWGRAIGGSLDVKSNSTTTLVTPSLTTGVPYAVLNGTVNCSSKVQSTYGGVQFGVDVARVVLGSWNIYGGVTAGTLSSSGRLAGGYNNTGESFRSTTQVPFFGLYGAVTNGGFFADILVRGDFYRSSMNAPGTPNLFNQKINANGTSVSVSAGYRFTIPNSAFFVEPSVGLIASRVNVDSLNTAGPDAPQINGTFFVNRLKNTIGRAGLRIGTTYEVGNLILQPFVSASIWHDFEKTYSAGYQSCIGVTINTSCAFFGADPVQVRASYVGNNFGTFGQYSVGVGGQLANTGWVGFARFDVRQGQNILGYSGNLGVRYQFSPTPDVVAKGPRQESAGGAVHDWRGFYAGVYSGAEWGASRPSFANGTRTTLIPAGFTGGLQAGYNFQFGSIVLGVEADGGLGNVRGSRACGPIISNTGVANVAMYQMTCHSSSDWNLSLAGRAGYAWERLLVFGKLGANFTNEKLSVTCNIGPLNGAAPLGQNCANPAGVLSGGFSGSAGRSSVLAGIGWEFAVANNWSIKAEYDYLPYGRKTVTATGGIAIVDRKEANEVKIGVNYNFASK